MMIEIKKLYICSKLQLLFLSEFLYFVKLLDKIKPCALFKNPIIYFSCTHLSTDNSADLFDNSDISLSLSRITVSK